MTSMTFFFVFIPILAIILLAVNLIFAPHNPYQEKDSAFECGFHSFLGQNRTQFSISFFIFALLFLLFDLEILLVYPYVVSAYSNGIYGLVVMLIFFLALTLGFAFELGKNALKIDSRQTIILVSKQNNLTTLISIFSITKYFVNMLNKIKALIVKIYLNLIRGGIKWFLQKIALRFIFCISISFLLYHYIYKYNVEASNSSDFLKFRKIVLSNPYEILCWIYWSIITLGLTLLEATFELFQPEPKFNFNSNTINLLDSNINLPESKNFNLSGQDIVALISKFIDRTIPMTGHWEGIDLNQGSTIDCKDKVSMVVSKNASTEDVDKVLEDSSYSREGRNLVREPVKDTSLRSKSDFRSHVTNNYLEKDVIHIPSLTDKKDVIHISSLTDKKDKIIKILPKGSYIDNIHTYTDNNIRVNMALTPNIDQLTALVNIQRYPFMRDPLEGTLSNIRALIQDADAVIVGTFMSWQDFNWLHFRNVANQLNNRLNTLIAELNNNPGPRVDHILAELRPLQDILTNLIREREGTFEEYREAAYIESRAFEDQLQVRFAFPDITGNRFHLAPLINLAITVTEGELSVLSENTLSIDNLERARNTTNALRHTLSRLLEHHNAILGPNNPRTIHLSAVVTSLEGQITSYSLAISNTEIWGYAHTRRHFIDNIISLHVSNITNLNYYRNTP